MRTAAIPVGERLGRYQLVRHLATGGMAEIYLARAEGIGAFERYVVLKVILGERQGDAQFVRMFLDEARLAAGLHHANVAQVYEVGEEAGEYFYAMEYVHGDTVRALLEHCGQTKIRIPLDIAVGIVIAAATALDHAHGCRGVDGAPLGIVHRDVSPSNVMVGYDGGVKVLDFGIARANERTSETVSGVVKGKYAYMAPEQCRAQPVDRRADVFSLGIVLYELTTQTRAFKAPSDFETMTRIVGGDVTPPAQVCPGYPAPLAAIVARAMAIDRDRRYQTAAALGDALEAFAESAGLVTSQRAVARFMHQVYGERPEPWRVGPLPPAGPARSPADTSRPAVAALHTDASMAPAIELSPAPPRPRRRLLWLGAAAAAAAIIAAAVLARSSERGPAASPPGAAAAARPTPGDAPTPTPAVAPPAAAPAPAAPTTEATPAPPSAPATVAIAVTTRPAGAAVYLGKRRAGLTPLTVELPVGDAPVALRLERAGYRSQLLEVTPTTATTHDVALVKLPARGGRRATTDDAFVNPFAK
ncbi:MAG: protein kinase [Kofleriaceae bacterium]